jgi:hypothetical protein
MVRPCTFWAADSAIKFSINKIINSKRYSYWRAWSRSKLDGSLQAATHVAMCDVHSATSRITDVNSFTAVRQMSDSHWGMTACDLCTIAKRHSAKLKPHALFCYWNEYEWQLKIVAFSKEHLDELTVGKNETIFISLFVVYLTMFSVL